MPRITADLPDTITTEQIEAALTALGLDPHTTISVHIEQPKGYVKAVVRAGEAQVHCDWYIDGPF